MTPVDSMAVADQAMRQIKKGAFLTVKAGTALNTMTIGWATIGFVWTKPIFMVGVRDSRHSFQLMENAADFTVFVPTENMKEALLFCGTKSGRDFDKFKECGLKTAPGQKVTSPVIDGRGIHFECRIVFKAPMDPDKLVPDYLGLYPEKDYHTLYFGEIVACYQTG
jgi:flavin reductase (DIM6/NTAB) family NADH-FMN oxidoreductase RutF